MKKFLFMIWLLPILGYAQTNIVRNGSFEGDFLNSVPYDNEDLYQNPPPEWEDYVLTNSDDDEGWFTDSLFVLANPNLPNTPFNNGYYSATVCLNPFDSTELKTLMQASSGCFFVGFNNSNDGNREGVQQYLGCPLNSGNYILQYDWARPFICNPSEFKAHISINKDTRRKLISTINSNGSNTIPGQWYTEIENFHLDLNNNQDMGNRWLMFTGALTTTNNTSKYIYLDDVRLYRPCDDVLECFPFHGQICPSVATMAPPGDLMRVSNIANASDLHLKISAGNGAIIKDTVYHNSNGLPDWRFTRLGLPISTAVATYQYDLEISNPCGAFKKTGNIIVYDTAAYNPITPYIDPTANWSGVPIPCCLSSLTLHNFQIVGDVSYIVRDQITVLGGVSLAPNSHVILQAGNVVEVSSAEFDGSNSSLEILEVPCPNRMACGNGCGGGSMVMDQNGIVMPPQMVVAADGQGTVKENKALIESTANAKPIAPAEVRLWTYPNPFEKEFQVGFFLPNAADCRLEVLDLQMRPIRLLLQEENYGAGTHPMAVDLSEMPAGVYFVRLQANGRGFFQRVVKQ